MSHHLLAGYIYGIMNKNSGRNFQTDIVICQDLQTGKMDLMRASMSGGVVCMHEKDLCVKLSMHAKIPILEMLSNVKESPTNHTQRKIKCSVYNKPF